MSLNKSNKKTVKPGLKNLKSFIPAILILSIVLILLNGCASSLQKAKVNLAQGQRLENSFQTEEAAAFYQKTLKEMEKEVRKNPSSQAYLLKGLAEFKLNKWSEAASSFSLAASLGEDKAESWAGEVSLYGLALSFEELGLEQSAVRLYSILSNKGKFSPVVRAAVGKLIDFQLNSLEEVGEKDREKILSNSLKIIEKALAEEPACGFYHYLLSQVLSHQKNYLESFEEAVMARELGLPSEEIYRDNDNQIVFCYRTLSQTLPLEPLAEFKAIYQHWINKWNWPDEETPAWKGR